MTDSVRTPMPSAVRRELGEAGTDAGRAARPIESGYVEIKVQGSTWSRTCSGPGPRLIRLPLSLGAGGALVPAHIREAVEQGIERRLASLRARRAGQGMNAARRRKRPNAGPGDGGRTCPGSPSGLGSRLAAPGAGASPDPAECPRLRARCRAWSCVGTPDRRIPARALRGSPSTAGNGRRATACIWSGLLSRAKAVMPSCFQVVPPPAKTIRRQKPATSRRSSCTWTPVLFLQVRRDQPRDHVVARVRLAFAGSHLRGFRVAPRMAFHPLFHRRIIGHRAGGHTPEGQPFGLGTGR